MEFPEEMKPVFLLCGHYPIVRGSHKEISGDYLSTAHRPTDTKSES